MDKTDSKVIVVTSGKGGVGKTTATANIGAYLSKIGKRVVLIDTDIGLRNLDISLGLENNIVYDLVDVLKGVCDISRALIKDKRFEGLYFIPAAQMCDKDAVSEEQMEKLCLRLKNDFDFVIIDCPAGIEQGFKNAVAGAETAIVVTTPEISALRDADRVIGLLEESRIEEMYLLINRIMPDMIKKGDMLNIDDVIERLGINLIGIVPYDESVIAFANKGELIVNYTKSKAGQGYKNIAKRLCGQDVLLMDLDNGGFFKRLKRLFKAKR